MENKFYVGQKVLCIKSQSQGSTKKGSVYIVEGVKKGRCCGVLQLDLGIDNPDSDKQFQCVCRKIGKEDAWWQGAERFIPIEDQEELSEMTIEELLEENVEA